MNKQTFIEFIKKYPMSILLAIIAINLYSIGNSLKVEKELNRDKLSCVKYFKGFYTIAELEKKLSIPRKVKYAVGIDTLCSVILES